MKLNNIKLHDKVIIKSKEIKGYVDTITPDGQYRIRTTNGYEWCRGYELIHSKDNNQKNVINKGNRFDYL